MNEEDEDGEIDDLLNGLVLFFCCPVRGNLGVSEADIAMGICEGG